MGATPDRQPGPSVEEEVQYEDRTADGDPSVVGALRRLGNLLRFRKASGGSGVETVVTSAEGASHESIDSLVHNLAENSYEEVTRSGGLVTSVIVWTDSGKTVKIRETTLTRSGGLISTIVEKQYDAAGALVQTLTGTVARTGGVVSNITWVKS